MWVAVLGIAAVVAGVAVNRRTHREAQHRQQTSGDEGDWSGPDEYERLTGISKESYEWRLLVATQSEMMGEWTVTPDDAPAYTRQGMLERGSVDDVRLEGDGLEAALVVLFRSDDRPGCVFGWRCPIWPAPSPDPEDPDSTRRDGPGSWLSGFPSSATLRPAFRPAIPTPRESLGFGTDAATWGD